jgi:hypothetical protein
VLYKANQAPRLRTTHHILLPFFDLLVNVRCEEELTKWALYDLQTHELPVKSLFATNDSHLKWHIRCSQLLVVRQNDVNVLFHLHDILQSLLLLYL